MSNGPRNRIEGKSFEDTSVIQAKSQGFVVVKMPLGARRLPSRGSNRPMLIQIKTPFDYILIKGLNSIYLDLKSFDNDHLIYSYLKEHQIETLGAIADQGPKAGYLVHFRPLNKVYFFSATRLLELQARESIEPSEGLLLGAYDSIDFSKLLLETK